MTTRSDPTPETDSGDGTAAEVAELLSDETRCAIVRELAQLSTEQWSPSYVRYSELRRAVGVEDGGKFNYHLSKLRGRLVEREDDEYRLSREGYFVATALQRGAIGGGESVEGATASTCPYCERSVTVSCRCGYVTATCEEHGTVFDMALPPAAAESHDPSAILHLALRRANWYVRLAVDGVCQECWGSIEATCPVPAEETRLDASESLFVEFTCERCDQVFWLPPGSCVLRHSAVVAFCHEHGQDVLDASLGDLEFALTGYPLVERTDLGVAVSIVRGDGQLRVELDEDANVIDETREPAEIRRPEPPFVD